MQLTVETLFELCKDEIKRGNGNKKIVISDDNEGNGYHGMFYGFTPAWDGLDDEVYDSQETDFKNLIVLG